MQQVGQQVGEEPRVVSAGRSQVGYVLLAEIGFSTKSGTDILQPESGLVVLQPESRSDILQPESGSDILQPESGSDMAG